MKFGCHVSIKEGYLGAAELAKSLGAEAYQFFPKNPRSLGVKNFNETDATACKQFCKQNKLVSITHTPYPTSLTPEDNKQEDVIQSLQNDLEISEACGAIGVVVHFGKQKDSKDPLASYHVMINILNAVLENWEGQCKILLENNAGKPGSMGTTMEELVQVRKLCDDPDHIGFCLDTCHAFASEFWTGENTDELIMKGSELGYFNYLEAIHLNNSKYPVGSGKDRHANIFGHGYIEASQFELFLQQPSVKKVPMILETPSEFGITKEKEIKQLYDRWG
ncbi:deoxyribonuclease-4 [Salirhabdus euzebyi]|uniref:Deoxyribonuclease-4 n=1 Tax=Salirhabdus euzebyi TaxID=394506 RepID=A0A841Q2D2_9BACI|nr:deoxyribonuclease IV [Salirhabdus euzebyi]MBB6452415.1 deoxyribonuclease-4 [Salirhabdus euzebyi]